MNKTITIQEAKANWSKYVKQAKEGKPVYIGAHGKEEVKLIASKDQTRKKNLNKSTDDQ